jgi:hypothetical protein
MTHPATANGADRHPLRTALTRAWNAATWAIPPDAWLDAAVDALTNPPHDTGPHAHPDPAELGSCGDQTVTELRRLHTEIRTARTATRCRRRELTDLQTRVRQRAIGTLTDNPELEDALRDALTVWGLPGIPTDYTVELTVPMAVTVAATDEDDARREAAALLEHRVNALGLEVSVDLATVQYTAISTD